MTVNYDSPEHSSVEDFVQFCMDDDRSTFSHEDLGELAYWLERSRCAVRAELESYGLTLERRPSDSRVRGFTTSSNDRWFGPGSSRTHGGSGELQITGFAGPRG